MQGFNSWLLISKYQIWASQLGWNIRFALLAMGERGEHSTSWTRDSKHGDHFRACGEISIVWRKLNLLNPRTFDLLDRESKHGLGKTLGLLTSARIVVRDKRSTIIFTPLSFFKNGSQRFHYSVDRSQKTVIYVQCTHSTYFVSFVIDWGWILMKPPSCTFRIFQAWLLDFLFTQWSRLWLCITIQTWRLMYLRFISLGCQLP